MLKSNLRNQVRQTPLPKWKPWIPLFEAVMNAFQAIRDANKTPGGGRILIEIERESSLIARDDGPIQAVRITDNGIGMDDDNFDSFNTSFSVHKEQEGGKGLGRFTWLKAFDRVEIDSTFIAPETQSAVRRNFVFDESYDPDKAGPVPAAGRPTGTSIYLVGS
jgi:Histidine kinase-, DNA gyrase B-, and HSP90-like ATPase